MTEIVSNDVTYEIFPLVGRQGLLWPYRLTKYMRGFIPADGLAMDVSQAIGRFFEECNETDFVNFCEGMLDTVHRNGKNMKVLYVNDFKGDMPGLYKLLIEICKFHFSGFFSELQNLGFSAQTEQGKNPEKTKIPD